MIRGVACGLVAAGGGLATADDYTDRTQTFAPSTAVHTHERAGTACPVARWAVPAKGPQYALGVVGGGRLALPPRKPDGYIPATDGTWGTDYVLFGRRPGRVFLDWWHDRPRQPQPGPYATDGLHPPDVVARRPVLSALQGGHAEKGEGKKE
jgi:hypothetical protein